MKPGALALAAIAACAAAAAAASFAQGQVAASPAPAEAQRFRFEGNMRQGGVVLGSAPAGTVALTFDGKPARLGADRRFLLGFDRDQGPESLLAARLAGGRTVTETLRIAPGSWRIEHIGIARRPTQSTEEYLRLRERELARIEASRGRAAPSDGWRQRFAWPARGRISGLFGSQRIYRGEPGSYHSGVDVAAGAGAAVVAPADGIVVLAGPPAFSLEGNLVIIDHGMGLNSAFLHLATQAVREGQAVRQGELIGTVGATGRATGPHLHWSMKWNEARIDPQALAGPMRP
jgi:murein DD-endopeptidase MepM/ murein hydrolase activator NlpD